MNCYKIGPTYAFTTEEMAKNWNDKKFMKSDAKHVRIFNHLSDKTELLLDLSSSFVDTYLRGKPMKFVLELKEPIY